MNPAGQPGQMARGQPNAQRQQPPGPFFGPADMDSLPLSDMEKSKYKTGLAGLWRSYNSYPEGSQQYNEVAGKIRDFSGQLLNKIRNTQRPPSQASSMGGMQGAQGAPYTQAGGERSMAASAGSSAANAGGQPAPASAVGGGAKVQGQQPQQANRLAGAAGTAQLRQHTNDVVAHAPPDIVERGPDAVGQWMKDRREKYGNLLIKAQHVTGMMRDVEIKGKALQQKGAAMTPEDQNQLQHFEARSQQLRSVHLTVKREVETIRNEQAAIRKARGLPHGTAPDGAASQAGRLVQQAGNNAGMAQPDSAGEASKGQAVGAAGRTVAASPQAGHPPSQASPITASAPQAAPAQQIKTEPGTSQPQLAPHVSTSMAPVSSGGIPAAATPTHNTARVPPTPIQTATPTTTGAPSLTHSAAIQAVNNKQRNPNQPVIASQNQLQGTPQGAGGTPSSAGVMGSTAQHSGHPHAHPSQTQPQTTVQLKLPIAKILPEKATMAPQPVNTSIGGVAPGRPTYTGGGGTTGGVMGQPILPKIPQIQMEGEGERVLNRKKLDDLVRQVCGGQAEGQEGNSLTPDVEEAVLTMADSFVDNLLHSACSIAKARGSKVLEIRDIQLVLERTYNIRIPGYATDELRAVRKVQPAVGWLTKISAIQASKVTGSKEF